MSAQATPPQKERDCDCCVIEYSRKGKAKIISVVVDGKTIEYAWCPQCDGPRKEAP